MEKHLGLSDIVLALSNCFSRSKRRLLGKLGSCFCVVAILNGCATPDPVKMEGDTFLIQKRSAQVGFGPPEGAKADVFEAANAFCNEKGLCVETVNLNVVNSGFGRPGSVALQFRCVPCGQTDQTENRIAALEERLQVLKDLYERNVITEVEYNRLRSEVVDQFSKER